MGHAARERPAKGQNQPQQIDVLKKWDIRWSIDSVATSLAIFWAEDAMRRVAGDARQAGVSTVDFLNTKATPAVLLGSLASASDKLAADFGKWNTPWGEINRFQRLTGDIVHPFNDAAPSIPVGFTSGNWGSLASFGRALHEIRKNGMAPAATALSP